jgi:hypothetical protein
MRRVFDELQSQPRSFWVLTSSRAVVAVPTPTSPLVVSFAPEKLAERGADFGELGGAVTLRGPPTVRSFTVYLLSGSSLLPSMALFWMASRGSGAPKPPVWSWAAMSSRARTWTSFHSSARMMSPAVRLT